jgi:lipopolysaccharide exporter
MDSTPTTTPPTTEPAPIDDRAIVSLRRVAGRGALASAGVEIGGRALTLLLTLVTARLLGPRETGLLGLAVLISGLVSFLGALPETAAVAAPRDRSDNSWAVGATLLRSLVLLAAGAVLLGLFAAAHSYPRFLQSATAPRLPGLAAILLLIPVLEVLNTYPQVALQRQLLLAIPIRAQALQYLTSSSAGLAALFLGFGVTGVAVAAVFGMGCASLLLWAQALGRLGPVDRCRRAQLRELVGDTGRVAVGSVPGYVAMRIDNVLVAGSLGTTGMGLYGMAWNASRLPLTVLARPTSVALMPALASIQNDPARVTRGIRESLTLTLTAVAGCSAVLVVSAPSLVQLVLGPSWLPVVPCLRVMAVTVLVFNLVPIASALLTATGRAHLQFWPALLGIACFLLMMPFIAARFGVLGAAFVDLLAAGLITLAIYVLARRSLPDVHWWSVQQVVPVAAAAASAALAWLAGHALEGLVSRLIVEISALGGGYVVFLRVFGGKVALASIIELSRRVLAPVARDPA